MRLKFLLALFGASLLLDFTFAEIHSPRSLSKNKHHGWFFFWFLDNFWEIYDFINFDVETFESAIFL